MYDSKVRLIIYFVIKFLCYNSEVIKKKAGFTVWVGE